MYHVPSGHGEGALADADRVVGQVDTYARRSEEGSRARKIAGFVRGSDGTLAHGDDTERRSNSTAGHDHHRAKAGRNKSASDAWAGSGWIIGHDGKAWRVEPSIRLLAHGVPARVGKLRAYGNAIVPEVAAEVIAAWMECAP